MKSTYIIDSVAAWRTQRNVAALAHPLPPFTHTQTIKSMNKLSLRIIMINKRKPREDSGPTIERGEI